MSDINIGRFRGGFCVYWHIDGKRTRHQLAARSRTEAEAEAVDVYRRETYARAPKAQTVADIWAAYVADLGSKTTAKTMGYTGKAVLAHFGAYRPDQITADLCRAYAQKREAAGISQGSVHTELGHLRSTMTHGVKTRMIDRAPSIERPAKPTPKERFLTHNEIEALIDAAPRHAVWVVTAFGAARSEKAASQWFSAAARKAGLADRTAHGLRKSRATALREAGATTAQNMAWLGHTTQSENEHYSSDADKRVVLAGVDRERKVETA